MLIVVEGRRSRFALISFNGNIAVERSPASDRRKGTGASPRKWHGFFKKNEKCFKK